MSEIRFDAPPTVAEFMRSTALFRIILGPVGSGKTTGCIFELLKIAVNQEKSPQDGIRYTRFAIVRQTFEQLRTTILKDIEQWLGKVSSYKVQDKTVTIRFGDVKSEWMLIPLEDMDDQRRLLSSQLTGAWMSEAIEMDVNLVGAILGRCGRYPSGNHGAPSWYGAIGDTNFPTEGSDWHKRLEGDRPDNWAVFKQPGGMAENAENLEWLVQTSETRKLPVDDPRRRAQGRSYYLGLLGAGNEDWVKRYVHAQYGADPSGSAVFRSTFKRTIDDEPWHVDPDGLDPVPGHNLIVSQDFGRNPFGLIGQVDHRGRLRVLEELEATDIGLAEHVKHNLRPTLMQERYIGLASYLVGDPSGVGRGAVFDDSPFSFLKREGFSAYPAPTNDIDKRLLAVEQWLLKTFPDGPALVIDGTRCPKLVMALSGMYRFSKRKNGQLNPLPEKNHPWSDVADALQYLCLVAGSGMMGYVSNRMSRATASTMNGGRIRQRVSSRGWT